MLYDPKWEKQIETKPDPFSLESLIAWLRTKPSQQYYDFSDPRNCMLCQYFEAMGFADVIVSPQTMRYGDWSVQIDLPEHFNNIAHAGTFGGALRRACRLGRKSFWQWLTTR